MTTESNDAMTVKVLIAWAGAIAGGITLNQLVLGATLIFTVLQIFMIFRRLWKGLP
jgi:hypothetical protein